MGWYGFTLDASGCSRTGLNKAIVLASPTMAFHQDKHVKPVRVGVIGTGNRGTSLLRNLLAIDGVEIPALCDLNTDRLVFARKMCVEAGQKEPEVYSKDEYSYKELMERENLDAVIIATYWDSHAAIALEAMHHGIYTGVEVPIALSLDECWDLINTSEKTGIPCMMLENWSFRRDNLAILNMIRQVCSGK